MKSQKPRPTLRQVALFADVSRATASNALRGLETVAPDTRDRVVAAANALGYRVNHQARRLRIGGQGTIGISVDERELTCDGPLLLDLKSVMCQTLLQLGNDGISVSLCPTLPDRVTPWDCDSMIVLGGAHVPPGMESQCVGYEVADSTVFGSSVSHDHWGATQLLLSHMKRAGWNRPGLISSLSSPAVETVRRSYSEWCFANGVDPYARVLDGKASADALVRDAKSNNVDALVIASIDPIAIFRALATSKGTDMGLGQLGDAGAAHAALGITNLSYRPHEVARHLAENATAILTGGQIDPIVVEPELHVRESTTSRIRGRM